MLALIDKTLLILEAKSGRVSPPARRGAEPRLRREIKALIVEPSIQSDRLRSLIGKSDGPLTLKASEGTCRIERGEIRHVLRANILFDTIGTLSSHWPQLVEHGLVDAGVPFLPP